MSKLTCPYCFEKFSVSQIGFRCLNPNPALCPHEDDYALAKYQRLVTAPKLNRVFIPANMLWSSLKLNFIGKFGKMPLCQCGERTKKVCSFCHNDLPGEFGEIKPKTIALIGSKEAGKSHYIAVLIHELARGNVGRKFNVALQALDDRTSERYRDVFEKPVYRTKEVIRGTISARAQLNYPLIYKLSTEKSNRISFKRFNDSSLVFFDTAGEDLDKIDVMSTDVKYLSNSDGIIFLLDPLQMSAVRNLVPSSVNLPGEHTEPEDIIGRAITLIRQSKGMGTSDVIKTPVAVTFSKIDAVRKLFDPSSPIHQASDHDGYFDLSDAEIVSENIKAHLAKWRGENLNNLLRRNFQTYNYFGISALGASPQADGRFTFAAAPFRVEDPFLWILHQQGIISGKRR